MALFRPKVSVTTAKPAMGPNDKQHLLAFRSVNGRLDPIHSLIPSGFVCENSLFPLNSYFPMKK